MTTTATVNLSSSDVEQEQPQQQMPSFSSSDVEQDSSEPRGPVNPYANQATLGAELDNLGRGPGGGDVHQESGSLSLMPQTPPRLSPAEVELNRENPQTRLASPNAKPGETNAEFIQRTLAPRHLAPGAPIRVSGPETAQQVANQVPMEKESLPAAALMSGSDFKPGMEPASRNQQEELEEEQAERGPIGLAAGPRKEIGEINEGTKNIAEGLNPNPHAGMSPSEAISAGLPLPTNQPNKPNASQMAKGATQAMSGAMGITTPLIATGVAASPFKAAAEYYLGIKAGQGASFVAKQMGATPDEQEFFQTLGFFLPSTALAAAGAAGIRNPLRDPDMNMRVPFDKDNPDLTRATAAQKSWGGGRVAIARVTTPEASQTRVKVGPFEARFGRGPQSDVQFSDQAPTALPPTDPTQVQATAQTSAIVAAASRAKSTQAKASAAAGLAPAPPPPPKPGEPGSKEAPMPAGMDDGALTQQTVQNVAKGIHALPDAMKPKATLEAVGNLAKWILQKGTIVGPDNKLSQVIGQTPEAQQASARALAIKIVNDEVERQGQQAEEARKQQEENAKTQQEEEKEAIANTTDGGASTKTEGEAPQVIIPKNLQTVKARQALQQAPPGSTAEQLDKAVRSTAMVTTPVRDALVQEEIARRANQKEEKAETVMNGAPPAPGQDRHSLQAWADKVVAGDHPFVHVPKDSMFKPNGVDELAQTKVSGSGPFAGTYYHAEDIPAAEIRKAARDKKYPQAALDKITADWKNRQEPVELSDNDVEQAPSDELTNEEHEDLRKHVFEPALDKEKGGRVLSREDLDLKYGEYNASPRGQKEPLTRQSFGRHYAEGTGPGRNAPSNEVEKQEPEADEAAIYKEVKSRLLARGLDPSDSEKWGTAVTAEERKVRAEAKTKLEEKETKPAEAETKPTPEQLAEGARQYMEPDDQSYYDRRRAAAKEAEKRFEKPYDHDLYNALHGIDRSEDRWQKMREKGATDEQLHEAVKKEFGTFSGFSGSGGDSIGHEVMTDKFYRPNRSQATKPTLQGKALVNEVRRLMQIPKPDSGQSPTTQNQQPAEKVEEKSGSEPALGQFKPRDKVIVKGPQGDLREGVVRFDNGKGKYVLKNERQPVRPSDIVARGTLEEYRAQHFAPGNVIKSSYWNDHDKVLSYDPSSAGKSWQVRVQKSDAEGTPIKGEPPRIHGTEPNAKDLVVKRAASPAEESKSEQPAAFAKPSTAVPGTAKRSIPRAPAAFDNDKYIANLEKEEKDLQNAVRRAEAMQRPLFEEQLQSVQQELALAKSGAQNPEDESTETAKEPETPYAGKTIPFRKSNVADAEIRGAEDLFESAWEAEKAGDIDRASTLYEQAAEKDPGYAPALVNLGSIRYNASRFSTAEDLFRRATEADPDYALAFFNLGTTLDELHKTDESIEAYKRAVALSPHYADAHYNLAIALMRGGKTPESLQHWQAYVRLDPTGPWSDHAREQIKQILDGKGLSIASRADKFIPPSKTVAALRLLSNEEGTAVVPRALQTAGAYAGKAAATTLKDAVKSAGLAGRTMKEVGREVVAWLYPRALMSEDMKDILGTGIGTPALNDFRAAQLMNGIDSMFNSLSQDHWVSFVDHYEHGQPQPDKQMQDAADLIRSIIEDQELEEDAAANLGRPKGQRVILPRRENYFPHRYKTLPGGGGDLGDNDRLLKMANSRRPLEGSKQFLKQQRMTLREAVEKGAVPLGNPVQMLRKRIQEGSKYIAAKYIMHSGKRAGLAIFLKGNQRAPQGYVDVPDKMMQVWRPVETEKGGTLYQKTGRWVWQEDFGRGLSNYLSRDALRDSKLGSSIVKLKNMTTEARLSWSAFHFANITFENFASGLNIGLDKLYNGGVRNLDGSKAIEGLADIGLSMVSPYIAVRDGGRMLAYAKNPDQFLQSKQGNEFAQDYPDFPRLQTLLFHGGARWGIADNFKESFGDNFTQLIREGSLGAATLKFFPWLSHLMMRPLFEHYIPRSKWMFMAKMLSAKLSQYSQALADGEVTDVQLARQVVDTAENRFGELNFDSMYWNNTFRTLNQIVFRSASWKLGSWRGLAKAAHETIESGKGTFNSSGFNDHVYDSLPDGGARKVTRRLPELGLNAGWIVSMALVAAVTSTVLVKMLTHTNLWEWAEEDHRKHGLPYLGALAFEAMHPRTGQLDVHGEPVRISFPTGLKDYEHFFLNPTGYVRGSLSDVTANFADTMENKDAFGNYVYNPNDPGYQKFLQSLEYNAKGDFLPMSVSNYRDGFGPQGATSKLARATGLIGGSPKSLDRSKALDLALELRPAHTPETPEQEAAYELTREHPTSHDVRRAIKEKKRDYLEHVFMQLKYADAKKVFDEGTPEERHELAPLLRKKQENMIRETRRR